MDQMAQFSDSFFIETNKLVEEFGALLLSGESSGEFALAEINEMFRLLHTIKGSVGMMDLKAFSALTHALEDLFVLLKKDAKMTKDRFGQLFDLLFEATDAMRLALADFAADGKEQRDFSELIKKITAFKEDSSNKVLRLTLTSDCVMENVRAFLIVSELRGVCSGLVYYPEGLESDADAAPKIRRDGLYLSFPAVDEAVIREVLSREIYIEKIEEVAALPVVQNGSPHNDRPDAAAAVPDGSNDVPRELMAVDNYVSVHLSKLDGLQNLVNELILEQMKVLQEAGINANSGNVIKLTRTSEALRKAIVSLRTTPVSGLFQKLHMTVREAGRRQNKEIEFVASGTDVEIDKGIIDALSESLVQIVRNAAAHGIEESRERLHARKPLMGKITVTARNCGTNVIIAVSDDGRGISVEQVMVAAQKNGLTVQGVPQTAAELLALLVQPGVTTSTQADEMSGRGVGLDVVRSAVDKLRGSLTLETQVGVGSTFYVRIPQLLAVMDCVCLGVGAAVFLLPAPDIYTLVQPHRSDLLLYPDGRKLYSFKGFSLPLLDLGEIFKIDKEPSQLAAGVIIIIEGEKTAVAVYADKLLGLQRTAVKPMPLLLERLGINSRGIAGCTILSDQKLGLILDVEILLQLGER